MTVHPTPAAPRLLPLAAATVVLGVLACAPAEKTGGGETVRDPSLDAVAAAAVADGFPGAVVATSGADGPIRTGAAGLADRAAGVPMEPGARLHAASTTKAFTAAAALMLADRGALSLQATLPELLPAGVISGVPHRGGITVRHLLEHTSGLYAPNNDPRYLARYLGAERRELPFWSPEEIVAFAAEPGKRPLFSPGEGHGYSDINYVLLALVVEEVSGRGFRNFVREEIFAPLGMEESYFLSAAPERPRARGYTVDSPLVRRLGLDPALRPDADGLVDTTAAQERSDGAAGVITTLPELVRFADAFVRGDLLRPASRELVLSVAGRAERGAAALGVLRAYRKPYGLIVTAEGDGPGIHVAWAMELESRTIAAAAVNLFGRWDESDYLLDEMLAAVLGEERGEGSIGVAGS